MEHDTLDKRLGMILTRLNTGERLSLSALAREFNVTERTLQRDFNDRLSYLPIERENSTYFIDPKFLGRQRKSDIKPLLEMLGLSQIFPSFDELLFSQLNTDQIVPFLFRNIKVEDTTGYEETFKSITLAIQENRKVKFYYKRKAYNEVSPYRLVNDRGWWYLVGIHSSTLKSFKVLNLCGVNISKQLFERHSDIDRQVVEGTLVWITDSPTEVVLRIESTIASHFRKTSLFPNQQLLKDLDNGSLLVTASITDQKQIIPILKYWLPDVEILSPVELKQSLLYELQFSIDQLSR